MRCQPSCVTWEWWFFLFSTFLLAVLVCGGITPPQQPQDTRGRRPGLTHSHRIGKITPIPAVLRYWEGHGAPHGSVMGVFPIGLGYPPPSLSP